MIKKYVFAAGAALAMTVSVMAAEAELPDTIALTTYDVGGTAYNQAIAVGKALQDEYGVSLRVVGTANDQAQLAPVREGRMPFSLAGSHVFYAFEGTGPYASTEWGPQPPGKGTRITMKLIPGDRERFLSKVRHEVSWEDEVFSGNMTFFSAWIASTISRTFCVASSSRFSSVARNTS